MEQDASSSGSGASAGSSSSAGSPWQEERGRAQWPWQRARYDELHLAEQAQPSSAGANPQQQQQRPRYDGGGAFTCESYTPGVDAVPANATLIRRLILDAPERLPGAFASLAEPTPDDLAEYLAARFGVARGTLRLAPAPVDADRTDALGTRHVRMEQVQEHLARAYGVEYGAVNVHLRMAPAAAPATPAAPAPAPEAANATGNSSSSGGASNSSSSSSAADGGSSGSGGDGASGGSGKSAAGLSAVEVYMVTGGYIDDVGARIAAGSRKGGPGARGEYGYVEAADATAIGVRAALGGSGALSDAAWRLGGGGKKRSDAGGKAVPTSDAGDVEAAAREGRAEPAGARGDAVPVVFCEADGTCHATWRQRVFVPAAYTSSRSPKEVHVYVSADDGRVIAQRDRLHTFSGRGARRGLRALTLQQAEAEAKAAAAAAARAKQQQQQQAQKQQQQPSQQPSQQQPQQQKAAAAPAPGAVTPPNLLPRAAYVDPPPGAPAEAKAAAQRINAILKKKFDGPAMAPSQGVGETLYSGTVRLDTAELQRLTRRGDKVSAGFVLTDLKRLGQRTYDLQGRDDKVRDGSVTGQLVGARKNEWGDGSARNRQTAAADAHWGMGVVFDYYVSLSGGGVWWGGRADSGYSGYFLT